jgi:hypothetical protein
LRSRIVDVRLVAMRTLRRSRPTPSRAGDTPTCKFALRARAAKRDVAKAAV